MFRFPVSKYKDIWGRVGGEDGSHPCTAARIIRNSAVSYCEYTLCATVFHSGNAIAPDIHLVLKSSEPIQKDKNLQSEVTSVV